MTDFEQEQVSTQTRRVPHDLTLARRLHEAANTLMWNLHEQYIADGSVVLKGGNEIVSMYTTLNSADAQAVAAGLEQVVGPLRRREALALLNTIDALSGLIRKDNSPASGDLARWQGAFDIPKETDA